MSGFALPNRIESSPLGIWGRVEARIWLVEKYWVIRTNLLDNNPVRDKAQSRLSNIGCSSKISVGVRGNYTPFCKKGSEELENGVVHLIDFHISHFRNLYFTFS